MLTGGATKRFRDLEVIFKDGEAAEQMYFVNKGKIQISKNMSGVMTKIAVLEEGELFGEMALFEPGFRSATATAVGNVELLEYDKAAFLQAVEEDPELALTIMKVLSQRLRSIDSELVKINTKGLISKDQSYRLNRYTFASSY